MIEIKKLSKKIGRTIVLDDIDLTIPNATIVGLQGINGSGKTMLIRSIAGLIKPTKGSVSINGKTLWKDISFPPSIGALIENPAFLNSYTSFDNLEMLASLKHKIGKREIRAAIVRVGLDPDDKRKYKKYSLGMKQRLGIAAAIMEKPDIVLLDEPTNALDEEGVQTLKDIITDQKKRGAIVVVASHDRLFLESVAEIIYRFENGRLVDSLKQEVIQQ